MEILQTLITKLKYKDIIQVINKIGDEKYCPAVPILIKELKSDFNPYQVRSAIALALSNIGDGRAIKPMIEILEDPNSDIHGCILLALEPFDYTPYIDIIFEYIFNEAYEIRINAFVLFEKIIATLSDDQREIYLNRIIKEVNKLEDIVMKNKRIFDLLLNSI